MTKYEIKITLIDNGSNIDLDLSQELNGHPTGKFAAMALALKQMYSDELQSKANIAISIADLAEKANCCSCNEDESFNDDE
ncbi:hypothetical protein KKI90_22245 [Xenorhabdus bovienii]|uniref:hypothetical protein n=1 Tax=Xenorhabdus bovienii TaxID=40576 RepID=UPI00237C89E6|nr:hypothetical protein [Xenorhabdus bovienii]MDE1488948.1 hypothetical protein [Xenorhabdus bovienii]MDE9479821.1 hypothetical protein [Xenorhabdus bovienii]MDE9532749.1 hypothetical protein [Xenorhabdus bovienii]